MQMKITLIICYMNLAPICPHCFKPGYEYTDVREYKKQPNKIAKTGPLGTPGLQETLKNNRRNKDNQMRLEKTIP